MSSNIIVPNEEILEKPFPLPYERTDLSENDLIELIKNKREIIKFIKDQKIKKQIFVPNKLLNIII